MGATKEQIAALAAATPEDIIRERPGRGGLTLSYITARDVMDRFDAAVGPANWQTRYHEHLGRTICEIGVKVGDEWVWKADGAGDTDIEAEKGGISDALKRAAVLWGVARDLYPAAPEKAPAKPPSKPDPQATVKAFKRLAVDRAESQHLEPKEGLRVLVDSLRAAGVGDADGGNYPGKILAALADPDFEPKFRDAIEAWEPRDVEGM